MVEGSGGSGALSPPLPHRCPKGRLGFCADVVNRRDMTTTSLSSLRPHYRALVFGASGGIGDAVARKLAQDPDCGAIIAASRQPGPARGNVRHVAFDLECEDSIAAVVAAAASDGPLDFVLVATGLLHGQGIAPEKSLRSVTPDALARSFQINAIGPSIIAKHALPFLRKDGKAVFAALSARVGSISDNRLGGWHSYRASKAALNMVIRTCSIELARTHPEAVCVALHPGTVDTGLSKPFQSRVADGTLFTPERSAACLLSVLDSLGPAQSGGLFAWDGQQIPF